MDESTEAYIEHISTKNYLMGADKGFSEAIDYILNLSGEAFKNGQDNKATLLRNLSEEMNRKSDVTEEISLKADAAWKALDLCLADGDWDKLQEINA